MQMSERSVRRKLSCEGTSLRKMLDEVRHERALQIPEDGARDLNDVAFELGFSSGSALGRAFRRWTGKSPTDFRRGLDRGEGRMRQAPDEE